MVTDQVVYLPKSCLDLQFEFGMDNVSRDIPFISGFGFDGMIGFSEILTFCKEGKNLEMRSFMRNRSKTKDGAIFYDDKKDTSGRILIPKDDKKDIVNIHLSKVSDEVDTIWLVIKPFTILESFDTVRNGYISIMDPNSKDVFCRFNIPDGKISVQTAIIVGCIKRIEDSWTFKALGYYCFDFDYVRDVTPMIK